MGDGRWKTKLSWLPSAPSFRESSRPADHRKPLTTITHHPASRRRERRPQPRILLELVRIGLPVGDVPEAILERRALLRLGPFVPVVPIRDALDGRRLCGEDWLDLVRARRVVALHAEDGAGHAAVEIPVDEGH